MRVLLVEDDPMIGEAVEGALKDASYAADWVKNGRSALVQTQVAGRARWVVALSGPRKRRLSATYPQ